MCQAGHAVEVLGHVEDREAALARLRQRSLRVPVSVAQVLVPIASSQDDGVNLHGIRLVEVLEILGTDVEPDLVADDTENIVSTRGRGVRADAPLEQVSSTSRGRVADSDAFAIVLFGEIVGVSGLTDVGGDGAPSLVDPVQIVDVSLGVDHSVEIAAEGFKYQLVTVDTAIFEQGDVTCRYDDRPGQGNTGFVDNLLASVGGPDGQVHRLDLEDPVYRLVGCLCLDVGNIDCRGDEVRHQIDGWLVGRLDRGNRLYLGSHIGLVGGLNDRRGARHIGEGRLGPGRDGDVDRHALSQACSLDDAGCHAGDGCADRLNRHIGLGAGGRTDGLHVRHIDRLTPRGVCSANRLGPGHARHGGSHDVGGRHGGDWSRQRRSERGTLFDQHPRVAHRIGG